MPTNKLVSIIIRTKDEERWITPCLMSVFGQRYKDLEVIIVDNRSGDKTIEKAKQFPIRKIVTCADYLPGKALNMGIREARGTYIACLSGHCIPVDDRWLETLVRNCGAKGVAGVYGRQEPMAFTPMSDKRDLTVIFGLDRKIQRKDSFFHNANSMIRKDLWEKTPFDGSVTNIEDRVWAQQMIQEGYKIVYEPRASVYHYHGIHQDGNIERCANVVRIMERLHGGHQHKSVDLRRLNVVAFIPVRGPIRHLGGKPLLAYTIERARGSKYIKRIIVATDDQEVAKLARQLGAEAPFLRPDYLSKDYVDIAHVLRYSLERVEDLKIYPDLLISLEVTFPFRPEGLLDKMALELAKNGLDTVIAARRENKAIWKEKERKIVQLDEGLTPRQYKDPSFIELKGVGCVTHPTFVRRGSMFGDRIGMYEVSDPYAHLEVRDDGDCRMASLLVDSYFGRRHDARR